MNKNEENVYTVEKLPYIYQSDFTNYAWGSEQYGFYTLPNGGRLKYKQPENWNRSTVIRDKDKQWCKESFVFRQDDKPVEFEVDDLDELIKPEKLFSNLAQCTKSFTFKSILNSEVLAQDVLDSLLISKVVGITNAICVEDGGERNHSLLIYIPELDSYKKILLAGSNGDADFVNRNLYAKDILQRFGRV